MGRIRKSAKTVKANDPYRRAIHEAGHAVLAFACGKRFVEVSIESRGRLGGRLVTVGGIRRRRLGAHGTWLISHRKVYSLRFRELPNGSVRLQPDRQPGIKALRKEILVDLGGAAAELAVLEGLYPAAAVEDLNHAVPCAERAVELGALRGELPQRVAGIFQPLRCSNDAKQYLTGELNFAVGLLRHLWAGRYLNAVRSLADQLVARTTLKYRTAVRVIVAGIGDPATARLMRGDV